MNAPLSNVKDSPRIVPINETEEVQNLRSLLREAHDELRKWRSADTSMHEIGLYESRAIEHGLDREVEYWDGVWRFLKREGFTGPEMLAANERLRWAKSARDKIVACREVRIIPDEDQ